jgi:hypothetical protein
MKRRIGMIRHLIVTSCGVATVIATPRFALAQTCTPDTGVSACNNATINSSSWYADWGKNLSGGVGVGGESTASGGTGVYGNGALYGTYGYSSTGYGVYGDAPSTGGVGVYGYGTEGVEGDTASASGYGVLGENDASGGDGVFGWSTSGSGSGYGVWGESAHGDGVHGDSGSSGSAVAGWNSGGGNGVWGGSNSGYAGNFTGGTGKVNAGSVYITGTCSLGCSSDERLKKNIAPLTGALDSLLRLRGVTFDWKSPKEQGENQDRLQRGFIAQEVEKTFPEWVIEDSSGFKRLVIPQAQIEALEVESIRALKVEDDDLRKRVAALESGRQPVVSGLNLNGIGLGAGGLAMASVLLVTRRRRAEPSADK